MNKYLAAVVIIILGAGAFFYFTSNKTEAPTNENNQSMNQNTEEQPKVEEKVKPVATIETSLGAFEVTLENEAAPKTVANFVKLSKDGFYNGLTFHRIVKQTGFHLIQGGDPKGDGTGGPGYTIPAEIGLKHTKGAIATARLADAVNPNKESSGSQFYIVEEDIPFLKIVVRGVHAVHMVRKIRGNTQPVLSEMGTITGDFSADSAAAANKDKRAIYNLAHASETPEEAAHEIEHWDMKKKIHKYKRMDE